MLASVRRQNVMTKTKRCIESKENRADWEVAR